jgi:hypothetical protein
MDIFEKKMLEFFIIFMSIFALILVSGYIYLNNYLIFISAFLLGGIIISYPILFLTKNKIRNIIRFSYMDFLNESGKIIWSKTISYILHFFIPYFLPGFIKMDDFDVIKRRLKIILAILILLSAISLVFIAPAILNNQFFLNFCLSLILLGATFSILSFNYSIVLEIHSDYKNILIASGKRFYLSTIFSVIGLALLFLFKLFYFPHSLFLFSLSHNLILFLTNYFLFILTLGFSFFTSIMIANSLIFFIEGIILSFKATINYKN